MSTASEWQQPAQSVFDENVKYRGAHNVIKNFALEAAQLLFHEGNPMGKIWRDSPEKSEILIADKHSFNLDQVAQNPAIIANRGPTNWQRTSGFRQLQSLDLKTDARTYTDLVRGSVILSCFSRSGLEAEDLAGYLFESFQAFRDVLRKIARRGIMVSNHLGFFRIEATNMGEEALVQSDSRPGISVVPVAILAHVQRRWLVKPRRARKLQGLQVNTAQRSG